MKLSVFFTAGFNFAEKNLNIVSFPLYHMLICPCILGHFLDQKRLKQGLYRHPWDDISYVMPETMGLMGDDTDKI
jgi:hypothetical protein